MFLLQTMAVDTPTPDTRLIPGPFSATCIGPTQTPRDQRYEGCLTQDLTRPIGTQWDPKHPFFRKVSGWKQMEIWMEICWESIFTPTSEKTIGWFEWDTVEWDLSPQKVLNDRNVARLEIWRWSLQVQFKHHPGNLWSHWATRKFADWAVF